MATQPIQTVVKVTVPDAFESAIANPDGSFTVVTDEHVCMVRPEGGRALRLTFDAVRPALQRGWRIIYDPR